MARKCYTPWQGRAWQDLSRTQRSGHEHPWERDGKDPPEYTVSRKPGQIILSSFYAKLPFMKITDACVCPYPCGDSSVRRMALEAKDLGFERLVAKDVPSGDEYGSKMSRTLGDYHGKINVRLRQGGMESTGKKRSEGTSLEPYAGTVSYTHLRAHETDSYL